MPDIFLSYNREDQAKAKLIAKALSDAGFDVWWDTVLRAGQTYDEVTERQLHAAKAVVVLWSSRSVKSKWVRAEATLGDRKSALIPVMIEPCDRPIMFELIQTADLVGWEGDTSTANWQAFVADVREHVERKVAATRPAAPASEVAPSQAAKAEPAASAETIEAAFWMSIQDGDDVEEFESYLERYPQGHFAALARKRIAALTAAKAPPVAVAPPPVPQSPPAQPAPPPAPPPKPDPALSRPAPRADAFQQKSQAAAAPRKGGSPAPVILGAIAAVVVVGVASLAFLMKPPGGEAPVDTAAVAAVPAAPETPSASPPVAAEPAPAPVVEKTFRDCDGCPEMMRLPGGAFTMGSSAGEKGHRAWEGPQREVTIAPLAVSLREVSFAEWEACVAAGGCGNYTPTDKGWGRGARPVIMVSWNDAQAYVKWLSGKTGKTYRLPTEAEWEYAARGGTGTAYWWGDAYISGNVPHGKTDETGAHGANAFGLFDVTGNVSEWVQDCYVNSFANGPVDGSAVTTGNCQRVIRGGGWKADAGDLRIASRSRLAAGTRDTAIGFRVVAAE